MYRVDISEKKLIPLAPTKFAELGLMERFDIQEWIEKTPGVLDEDLLVIGKEVSLSSGKRIDLLCLDRDGALVIVELKRDDSGSSVEWQAIKYAAFCSQLLPEEVIGQYAGYLNIDEESAEDKIYEFLGDDECEINPNQRIILVSREFNSEVLSAVLWLREHGLNIQCTKLAPYLDIESKNLFIKPETIIPLPEIKDFIEQRYIKKRNVSAANHPASLETTSVKSLILPALDELRIEYEYIPKKDGVRANIGDYRIGVWPRKGATFTMGIRSRTRSGENAIAIFTYSTLHSTKRRDDIAWIQLQSAEKIIQSINNALNSLNHE